MSETTNKRSNLLLDRRARFLMSELKDGEPDDVYTSRTLAHVLGVSTQFLDIGRMKTHDYGPKFFYFGIQVGYRRDEVLKWLEKRAKVYEARRKGNPTTLLKLVDVANAPAFQRDLKRKA